MKAIVYHEYGTADVLRLEEVPKPVPKDNEVLIKVRAASINPLDWRLMHGEPKVLRFMAKLMKFGGGRIGVDVAGEVAGVGAKVKQFKIGDVVFGSCRGAVAEYACSPEKGVVAKPASVTFPQATSINVAGLTALQGLRDKGQIRFGHEALINGASGGVGTYAVQIAKSLGAHVTAVCSTRNLELVKSIGADSVIDYTKEDFTERPERYDLIFDCIGNKSPSACQRLLRANGHCVMVGAPHDFSLFEMFSTPLKAIAISMFSNRKVGFFVAKSSAGDLTTLGDMVATGKLKPVIEREYALSEAAEAMRHLEAGHARGKLVVRVSSEP